MRLIRFVAVIVRPLPREETSADNAYTFFPEINYHKTPICLTFSG